MRAMRRLRERATLLRTAVTSSAELQGLRYDLDELRASAGRVQARLTAELPPGGLAEAEFKVFSQFGEDGIVQHLLRHVPIEHDVFVEFGVDDYRESNTRFLLYNDNWRGLVIDGGARHVEFLRDSDLMWRHEIDPVVAFIDRDNIDGLITGQGIRGDIGLLSVDIDGNDYWVLERIVSISPRILIVEFNSTLGPQRAVTIPYDPGFVRTTAHWSWLYFGASLAAITKLADDKGYALVGCNSNGNNAFFVRRDVLGPLPERSVAEAWRPSRFRESHTRDGELSYVSSLTDRLRLIRDMQLVDLENGQQRSVAEIYGV